MQHHVGNSECVGLCGAIHCFIWLLPWFCMLRHLWAMLLHGCLSGDCWGRCLKWGTKDTCTRVGVSPNLDWGAILVGSGWVFVRGMLLHGCLFGDCWGRCPKWGTKDTCTRVGVFPNLAWGAISAGSGWVFVRGYATVPRHAAPCCSPMGPWIGPSVAFFMLSGAGSDSIRGQACLVGLCADWVVCSRLRMGHAVRDACEWW